jgi:hypothetical protein
MTQKEASLPSTSPPGPSDEMSFSTSLQYFTFQNKADAILAILSQECVSHLKPFAGLKFT